jgi:hypothetical protein
MMKCHCYTLLIIFLAGNALAGGIELNKDAVSVSPPDPDESVTITGPPGCVISLPPIYIMARNKNTGVAANGSALPNGSFILRIPASGQDIVKLTFVSANGKKKDLTVKVPPAGEGYEAGAQRQERPEVNVDLGQFSQFGAPEVVQVKPDGRGGHTVHVGARPTMKPPLPTPTGTTGPSPTPSPEPEETPLATQGGEEGAATPAPEGTATDRD